MPSNVTDASKWVGTYEFQARYVLDTDSSVSLAVFDFGVNILQGTIAEEPETVESNNTSEGDNTTLTNDTSGNETMNDTNNNSTDT